MELKEKMLSFRKAELRARDSFQYRRILSGAPGFLPGEFIEDAEEVELSYEISGKRSFSLIREERYEERLSALSDIAELYSSLSRLSFSLSPDNLYFDIRHRAYVLFRDLPEEEEESAEERFLKEYQALIGYSLQEKYSYEDFLQGGGDLLREHGFLREVEQAGSPGEIQDILETEYRRRTEEIRRYKILVDRRSEKRRRLGMLGSGILSFFLLLFFAYQLFYLRPYEKAVDKAVYAYLQTDYVGVIDDLSGISLRRLKPYQRYILALSYVKSENLSEEQKGNILSALDIRGNPKLLEYWINYGRSKLSEAENLAMQMSEDQLLLYALLKERYLLELNEKISGEEKEKRLKELSDRISSLSEGILGEEQDDRAESEERGTLPSSAESSLAEGADQTHP